MQPKQYVAGSSRDAGGTSPVFAVTAAVVGVAAIAVGISLTAQDAGLKAEKYAPLSEYVSKCEGGGGLAAAPAAPALAD